MGVRVCMCMPRARGGRVLVACLCAQQHEVVVENREGAPHDALRRSATHLRASNGKVQIRRRGHDMLRVHKGVEERLLANCPR